MTDWTVAAIAGAAVAMLAVLWRRSARHARAAEERERAAERALADAARDADRLVASLGGTGGGIVVLDEQQRIVATNAAARELASLPPDGGRGRNLSDLVGWPQLEEGLASLRDGRPDAATAAEFERNDGGSDGGRALIVRLRALPGLGYVIAIDDHSRIKRLESLRRDFVANVSHELKTPLAAIQGIVETLLDDPDMPVATRHRFLDKLARQSERLTTLVADLLTLSRLDEARPLDDGEPCDFGAVVRETLRDLVPLAEKRGLRLQGHLPEHPVRLRADREGLRQVAGNLVDNAIKYTPSGGAIHVRIVVGNDHVQFEVADTGIGLSPADQERVFERFYRVDRARSRELGGTGLGLSIVKNTVRGLGGEVGVQSAIGEGSTFWVRLPLPVPPAAAATG